MNNDIEKALTLTYEIEGLLHLLEHRQLEQLPASIKKLLTSKAEQLRGMLTFNTLTSENKNESADTNNTSGVENISIDASVEEEVETLEAMSDNNTPIQTEEAMQLDEEKEAETVEFEQMEDSTPDAGVPDAETTRLDEAQAEEDEADTEAAESEKANKNYYGEIVDKHTRGTELMKRFSINDRYRFTRELFGYSTDAFNAILAEISTFSNITEVDNYLNIHQGINTSVGAGKDFLAIIAPVFNK